MQVNLPKNYESKEILTENPPFSFLFNEIMVMQESKKPSNYYWLCKFTFFVTNVLLCIIVHIMQVVNKGKNISKYFQKETTKEERIAREIGQGRDERKGHLMHSGNIPQTGSA